MRGHHAVILIVETGVSIWFWMTYNGIVIIISNYIRNTKFDEYSFTHVELIAMGPDQIVCLQATYTIRAVHTVLIYK